MKKIFSIILCLALTLSLAACTKVPETEGVPTGEYETNNEQIPNPMQQLTEEEFNNEFNTAAWVPKGSENVEYYKIDSGSGFVIAQINFTRFDKEYCFRFAQGEEQDISGMYYEWAYQNENDSSAEGKPSCQTYINEDEGAGVCNWYDSRTGTNYSITMSEGATRDLLISTFDTMYGYYCAIYN